MSTLPLNGPKWRSFDSNGDPLAGGKLYSYAAGTTTPLNTYTTWAGTIANTNPVILDANGEADVWTTPNLLYKFVLQDAGGVVQWTVDNFPSSSGAGSGAGSGATSDVANAIDPGGRLTLVAGAPEVHFDVTGATTIFYAAQHHNTLPLYDGAGWVAFRHGDLSQALSDATKSPAPATDDKAYDMFIWNDAGTLRLSRGPAWASENTRGTGVGTTELFRLDGRLVNLYSISNGPAALKGLYVGSILVDQGGVADSMAMRHVWNYHNRLKRPMRVIDPTPSWTYSTDVFRQANGSALNELNVFVGIIREPISVEVQAAFFSSGQKVIGQVGIGLDSSTADSSTIFSRTDNSAGTDSVSGYQDYWRITRAVYENHVGEGRHALRWLERAYVVIPGPIATWYGTYSNSWTVNQSGIWGHVFA